MFESKACWSHTYSLLIFRHDMKIGQYNWTMLNLQPVLIEELIIFRSKKQTFKNNKLYLA
jgi:hypothetical protein